MPSKKYIITVLDGYSIVGEFIKYSRDEADAILDRLDILDCNYQVEILELH